MLEEKDELEAIIHLARKCKGIAVKETETGYLLTKIRGVPGQCPVCNYIGSPDANYCGKCGYSYINGGENIESRTTEIAQQAIDMLQNVVAPTPKSFAEQFSNWIKEHNIKSTVERQKLILEKQGRITAADKALMEAYNKRQKAIDAAEDEYAKVYNKFVKRKDNSFGIILRIGELKNILCLNVEANVDDYGLVLYFPKAKLNSKYEA
ncbi:MAG: zinc ribbon domain-containing protein [Candidatus Micrarchaeota archaeon]|nr:zinc ribbon domain-containing protein [Candidatus Micrarchaeota archaeon]